MTGSPGYSGSSREEYLTSHRGKHRHISMLWGASSVPGNPLAQNLLPCFIHIMWVISGPSDLAWIRAHPGCITSETLPILFPVFTACLVNILHLPRKFVFLIHQYVGISLISFIFLFQLLFYCRLRFFRSYRFAVTTLQVWPHWSNKLKWGIPAASLSYSLAVAIEMTQGADPSCHQCCCQHFWPYAEHGIVPTDSYEFSVKHGG